jgi:DNA-directed RNA polymerase I subunit RPA1
MAEPVARRFWVKMLLLRAGMLKEALELETKLSSKFWNADDLDTFLDHNEKVLNEYETLALANIEGGIEAPPKMSAHIRAQMKAYVKQFFKQMPAQKCVNCRYISPVLRKDGHTKIFQKPLSNRFKANNDKLKVRVTAAIDDATLEELNLMEQSASLRKTSALTEVDAESSSSDSDDGNDSDSSSDDGNPQNGGEDDPLETAEKVKYLPPYEVTLQTKKLWEKEGKLITLLYGALSNSEAVTPTSPRPQDGWSRFFLQILPVVPSRFRPPGTIGEMQFEHPQNVYLEQILRLSENLASTDERSIQKREEEIAKNVEDGHSIEEATKMVNPEVSLSKKIAEWIDLQDSVNCLMDSSKSPIKRANLQMPMGIRQTLEKKDGLFRKHMMGKRVNFAARSVISPDPYLSTGEIGVPYFMAKRLTFPEPVTAFNVKEMRRAVLNGADIHPGACAVINEKGQRQDLTRLAPNRRAAIAKQLLHTESSQTKGEGQFGSVEKGFIVERHLRSGDCLLVNRQPTLHKPGIMAHRARVLTSNTSWQTIRMHYANCNTYNADFDGDEMNIHFPQDTLARAEAYEIAANDKQYTAPTDGSPLRGLMQDHVGGCVLLCKPDTFLTREQYQQLLWVGVASLGFCGGGPLSHATDEMHLTDVDILLTPAILKPKPRWTGKQLVSSLLMKICRAYSRGDPTNVPMLSMDGKTKTPKTAWAKWAPGLDKMGNESQVHMPRPSVFFPDFPGSLLASNFNFFFV